MANIPRPVYIDGTRYESVAEACALAANPRTGQQRITRQLVNRSIRAGRPGWYYEDVGQEEAPPSRSRGAPGRAVVADGKTYPTIPAAMKALGIGRQALIRRINDGTPGTYYVDEGQRPDIRPPPRPVAPVPGRRGRKSKPFVLDGVAYESLGAAATAMGKSIGYVRNALARARKDEEDEDRATKRGTPILVNGVHYDSMTDAARALKIDVSRLSKAAKRLKEIRQAARSSA